MDKISTFPTTTDTDGFFVAGVRVGSNVKIPFSLLSKGTTDDLSDIKDRLSALEYVAPSVTGMSSSVGTVEIGSTVSAVTLNWSVNKTITTQSIDHGVGTLAATLRTLALSSLALTSDTSWTLTIGDGSNTATRSAGISFRHRRRWGYSVSDAPDSTLIDALAGVEFSTGRSQSRSMSPSGQYIYFAWPSSWGDPTFTVNGLPVAGWIKTTISYTNPSGNTTNFDVYRSEYVLTGTFSVVVS